jgi:uncharacterized protein YbjT (DUF2867 family)
MARHIFITGATGYIGRRLVPVLLGRGHRVTALARKESLDKLPKGCGVALGNALDAGTYAHLVGDADTFIQLVGVAHPGPAKASQFLEIDLKSGLEAVKAARATGISHFVYLSVAHPAPVMKAYIEVRSQCERSIEEAGLNSTILRPWYVLGPGHRWPYLLIPFYKFAEAVPSTRHSARRFGLVTLSEMTGAISRAVDNPPQGIRILEVPEIRKGFASPTA